MLPKYVDTPELSAVLRVQPHHIRGVFWPDQALGSKTTPSWDSSRLFDAYVHPATFPEISNCLYYCCAEDLDSFLVAVKLISPLNGAQSVKNSEKSDHQEEQNSGDFDGSSSKATSPLNSPESLPASDVSLELSNIINTVAGLIAEGNTSPGEVEKAITNSVPTLHVPDSLVLRLCFAKKLVCGKKSVHLPLSSLNKEEQHGEEEEEEEEKKIIRVAPGHILLSSIVRQQLKAGNCSLVRVTHVLDERRLPSPRCGVTIHLHAVNHKAVVLLEVSGEE